MPLLNDFRVHVRGNTVLPPSVDCFLQQVGDVTAQCQAPWLVGVKPQGLCFDVLAGSPEDTRSANRKSGLSFANGLYPLSAWSRNSQTVPLRGRHGRQRGKLQSTTNPPVRRQTAPFPPKSPVSSKTLVAREKPKCALIGGRLPSSLRNWLSRSPPAQPPHQPIRMHEAHGVGNQQGPRSARFLETRLASLKTAKRKPPREVRPSSTGPGSWAECRPQPLPDSWDTASADLSDSLLPLRKGRSLSQPLREKYLHLRPRDRARQPDRSIGSRNETHGIGWWQRTQFWPASAEFDEAAAPGMDTRERGWRVWVSPRLRLRLGRR